MKLTTLQVNGRTATTEVDEDTPLLWFIRDELGLRGTKFGCGKAQCGACTVHLDGVATRSCVLPIGALAAAKITTIEGLTSREAKAVQEAWIELDVAQCGYCQSGQIMSAVGLLQTNRQPSDAEIDVAMNGNLCRCATYQRIRAAIHLAAAKIKE